MKNKFKIYHISDTHGYHNTLKLPKGNFDVTIHSGDESNHFSSFLNEGEFYDFINWYQDINDIEEFYTNYKILIPGNHSSYIYHNEKRAKEECRRRGILLLIKDEININGFKIYGDPITPTFGNWSYMVPRHKIYKHWDLIPNDVDILITHGPPRGILDISTDINGNNYVLTGCTNLMKKIEELPNLKLHCFGHIHGQGIINNFGLRIQDYKNKIIFSNASAVKDREFNRGIVNHGNIIELDYK